MGVVSIAAIAGPGCASEVPRRDAGVVVGSRGHSESLVFAGSEIVDAQRWDTPGTPVPERSRRDVVLNARADQPTYPLDLWPQANRPTLSRPGRVHVNTSQSSFLYFREERRDERVWWRE